MHPSLSASQIPPDATPMKFYIRNVPMTYYTWKRGNKYYWECLGNTDTAKTLLEAQQAAREWIKNGYQSFDRG